MKGRPGRTLYDVLDVPRSASPQEVEQAYRRARAIFGPDSLASYSLFSPDEAAALSAQIEEARAVLLDARARARYDASLSGAAEVPARGAPVPPAPRVEVPRTDFRPPEGAEWTGDLIRQARLAAGLSVLQVSERTKLQRAQIEDVESERYDRLPPAVYLRGILRSLAILLHLDAERVVGSYLERAGRAR